MDSQSFNGMTTATFSPSHSIVAVDYPNQHEHQKNKGRSNHKERTPLSQFVRERLHELGLKQADFCRLNTFDQGMLSRIQNSMVYNLNLESVLRLAVGLQVSPLKILELIGRTELHELIRIAYANDLPELANLNTEPVSHS